MRTRRQSPGHYEIETAAGTYRVYRRDNQEERAKGYDLPRTDWAIVWPNETYPDATAPTLREAKEQVARSEAMGRGRPLSKIL